MTDTKTPSPSDALSALFREALAWGMTYGPEIPAHQWDEMRESMVLQYVARWGQPQAVAGGELVDWIDASSHHLLAPPPQAVREPLTESEMGEGWRAFQERLEDLMAADPGGLRNMGREHWLSWAHWKAACQFAHGITKGGQHG